MQLEFTTLWSQKNVMAADSPWTSGEDPGDGHFIGLGGEGMFLTMRTLSLVFPGSRVRLPRALG